MDGEKWFKCWMQGDGIAVAKHENAELGSEDQVDSL